MAPDRTEEGTGLELSAMSHLYTLHSNGDRVRVRLPDGIATQRHLSGVCLNSLLAMSQRNSVGVMIEGGGEARWVWKEAGISFFNKRRIGFEVILNEDF